MWSWIFFFIIAAVAFSYVQRQMRKKNISGQVVLITGGASGLGKLLAQKCADAGCTLVLWDLNKKLLDPVVDEFKKKGVKVFGYTSDVSNYSDVQRVASLVKNEVGKVDILVNNAGIVSGKFITDLSEEHIRRTIDVNTTSHFWTLKEFLPEMIEKNSGHVVTIASAAGICGVSTLVDYCASKFGAFGAAESLRLELRKRKLNGIDTLLVCPFYINTGMFEGVRSPNPLLPILDQNYVVERIFDSIIHRDKLLTLPWLVRITWFARSLLPVSLMDTIGDYLGVSNTMDDFKGRGWEINLPKKEQ